MNKYIIFHFSILISICTASDWVPNHKDAPIPPVLLNKLEAALPDKPIVETEAKRRILIYGATNGFRHKSIPIGTLALEKMGLLSGAYVPVVSNHPKTLKLKN